MYDLDQNRPFAPSHPLNMQKKNDEFTLDIAFRQCQNK